MQEHYTSHQHNQLYSPSPAHFKNTSGDKRKRGVAQYAPSFDLATLNGNNGFVIEGLAASDFLGQSVSTVGDLNGDGKADLALGACFASPGGRTQAGTAYVIFGQVNSGSANFNLTTLNGTNGFVIEGLAVGDRLGCSVSTAGDVNGDGKTDLIVGAINAAPGGRTQAGTAYVIFGQSSGWSAKFDLTTLNGSNGFVIEGLAAYNELGWSVSTVGDFNSDGKDDLVVGAPYASPSTAYIIFGQASGWPANFNLVTLNGANGFVIEGGDYLGRSVSTVGDLNGDGKSDLVVGAWGADPGGRSDAGTVYVIFGQVSGWPASFNLMTLNGTNGFVIEGLATGDYLGYSVSTAGDLNGDGKADLLVGAYGADPGGRTNAGTAYVIFGQVSGWLANFNLATINGSNGFVIEGLVANDQLGWSVSTAGDLNGDDKGDLVIGANNASPGHGGAGAAYVIFGQAGGWPANFNLATLNGTNGFVIAGLANDDQLGRSVSVAGDLNGDGKTDLVVSAYAADPGGRLGAGTAYVIFSQYTTTQYTPAFNLTTLNGSNGFAIPGFNVGDNLGQSVSTAGDINNDGKDDFVLGVYLADPSGRYQAGTAYVIFGQTSNWFTPFNVTTLNGTNGFIIEGINAYDDLGQSASTAGDINGDGKGDLIVGAYAASPDGLSNAGTVYVLFGQTNAWPNRFNLSTLNGNNGFTVDGLSGQDYLGYSVNTAGDVNGDGKADIVFGAHGADPGGRSAAGIVYVLFGQASGWPSRFNLSTLNGNNGFAILGLNAGDELGWSVSTGEDINGDGKADLILGAYTADPGGRDGAGTAYVLFGQASGWPSQFDLTTLNGSNGFTVEGLNANDQLGYAVSMAGDINGDGKADLVLGVRDADPDGRYGAGTVYVLFGQTSGWPSQFNLSTLNGSNGFAVDGLAAGDQLGQSVNTAGDLNGDGKGDLVLGAYQARSSAGIAYVLFGQGSGWPSRFDLTSLNGTNGFTVEGPNAGDFLGVSVNAAGDINGDGRSDLLLGANRAAPDGRTDAGMAYVIFGQSPTITPTSPPSTPTSIPTPTPTVPTSTPTPIFVPMPATPTPVLVNRPPQVDHTVLDQTAEVNQTFSFQMASDTFSDPDGDLLTYTAAQSGSSILPSWLQFNQGTRFFSGIPSQLGTTPINVTASDPSGLSASTAFNINVQKPSPLISDTGSGVNGGLIGGIIGGLAAVGGLAGVAYLAYKRGFFGSSSRDSGDEIPMDPPQESPKKIGTVSPVNFLLSAVKR